MPADTCFTASQKRLKVSVGLNNQMIQIMGRLMFHSQRRGQRLSDGSSQSDVCEVLVFTSWSQDAVKAPSITLSHDNTPNTKDGGRKRETTSLFEPERFYWNGTDPRGLLLDYVKGHFCCYSGLRVSQGL